MAADIGILVEEYGKDIYNFCRKLTYSEFDAEELYQDTFLRAIEIAGNIDLAKNPKSFLISVSISVWKNNKRKFARRKRIAPSSPIDDEMETSIENGADIVEEEVLKRELYEKVNTYVDELDEKYRIPILMYYNSGLDIGSIAKALGCPEGTVKSRLYKGRNILKSRLEVYGIDEF